MDVGAPDRLSFPDTRQCLGDTLCMPDGMAVAEYMDDV
jgi:hypothetical protein